MHSTEYPDGSKASSDFDEHGRLISSAGFSGNETQYVYPDEEAGIHPDPIAVTNALGESWQYQYTVKGQLQQVTSPSGAVSETLTLIVDTSPGTTTFKANAILMKRTAMAA